MLQHEAPLLACQSETRDLSRPLDAGIIHVHGIPDAELYVEDAALGITEPIRVRVVYVDVPGQRRIRGAYLRTERMEWTLVVAEADRLVGFGAQRLFAAVREHVRRSTEQQIEAVGKMPELRPAGSGNRPAPIRSFVPR